MNDDFRHFQTVKCAVKHIILIAGDHKDVLFLLKDLLFCDNVQNVTVCTKKEITEDQKKQICDKIQKKQICDKIQQNSSMSRLQLSV